MPLRWAKKGAKSGGRWRHKSLLAFLNWLSGPTHSALAAVAADVAGALGQD